ncbi:Hypothetical_protein [Hexamita inflata]|uniref:Hypothetical_protein n=1 Tax=Hexamita inflata TaxID=28002 RepID=A0AA86ULG9_9EUKA|nr:Hypothetical protein HINF_LOCUS50580 [Hexamita inflata]
MYLYIQLTLNKCTTDICCFKANLSEHLVQGECQSCPELYDYDKQQCTTCQLLYGEWSYYLKGDCYCGGGSVGKNTYCDDCWQRRMIVYNNQCVTCASFDKNAYYEYQNRCACVKNLEFNNFKCHWYSSAQQRVIIIEQLFQQVCGRRLIELRGLFYVINFVETKQCQACQYFHFAPNKNNANNE